MDNLDKFTDAKDLLNEIKEESKERYDKINKVVHFRTEKIKEYKEKHNIPEFETPEEYAKWLGTTEGKKYAVALEKIREDAEKTIRGRGGYRPNAGRKKIGDRVAIHKRVDKGTVVLLKDYSKKHHLSENEALDKLVNAGYRYLKEA